MRGEKLIGAIVKNEGKPTDWPNNTEWSTEYFVTDKRVYEYAGDRFIKLKTVPTGRTAEGTRDAINKIILDIKKTTRHSA